jgi:outer membrane protein assembly factor BamB
MIKNNILLNKTLVIVILLLFIGLGFGPSISGEIVEIKEDSYSLEYEVSASSTTDWWPMFNHDLLNTGNTTSNAPDTHNILWTFNPNDQMASPVVYDDKVFVGSDDGIVYCLNMYNGEQIWNYTTNGEITVISPAVEDGRVYIGSWDEYMYCLDADTGDKIWSHFIGDWIESSPAIYDGRVYFGSYDRKVYCLEASTGDKIWEYATDYWVITSPAIYNDRVYIGSFDGNLYCLNAYNGHKIWNFTANDRIQFSSPCISNGKVYFGADCGNLYCLDAENGDKLWAFPTAGRILSSPAVAYGNVYFGSDDTYTYCIDAETGVEMWNYSLGNQIHASPSVADGKVYIASMWSGAKICCLNAHTGYERWSYPVAAWSSPAICDGKVFFGCYNLYCFRDTNQPDAPIITGPTQGTVGVEYEYSFSITDPDGDAMYLRVDWEKGPGKWDGPFPSGSIIKYNYTWKKKGTYKIRAQTQDIYGLNSDWGVLDIIIPRTRAINTPFLNFLKNHPNLFPIIRYILRL